jgi:protein involved in polysaccharide export with SLBB domain
MQLYTVVYGQMSSTSPAPDRITFKGETSGAQEEYKLRIGDILRIMVLYPQQQLLSDYIINIQAQGKTITEIRKEVEASIIQNLALRQPIISVTLEKYRPIRGSVLGSVSKPGVFEFQPGDTVATMLSSAGGPLQDGTGDLRRATLKRAQSNELIPVDLYAILNEADTTQNYPVEDGDELTVPQGFKNVVVVLGEVQRPGTYPFKEPMRLTDAISAAQGEVRYRSNFRRIMVIREKAGQLGQYEYIPANLVRFFRNHDWSQNVLLKPGDVVLVPRGGIDWERVLNISASLVNLRTFIDSLRSRFTGFTTATSAQPVPNPTPGGAATLPPTFGTMPGGASTGSVNAVNNSRG